ncbi:DMT family transporter [Marinobacter caseinilyticus]|uniref:DMT family transporter n=1 Tax=Marinobacter caseinilyticus TaxID=2692195 RepID=UPI001A946BE2|nr:DMT family transporter [Marinobacter caseinilyticus]
MTSMNQPMGRLAWGLLLLLSLLWGGSFFFVGVAVEGLPPLTIVALRVGLAALALNVILVVRGTRLPRGRRIWTAFIVMGVLNNLIPFSLIVWGQTQIASGLASILNATTPLFTVVVAHVLTSDEKLNGGRLVGTLVGFFGVALMIGPDALSGQEVHVVAQLAVLGAALSYAFGGVFGRRFKTLGTTPLVTATGQVTASSAMLMPMALWVDEPWALPLPSAPVWAAVLGLALFSTALAYILYFRVLAIAGATNLLLVTLLIPVSAILLGSLVLGERLEVSHFGGMAIIAMGLLAIDGRLWAFARARLALR